MSKTIKIVTDSTSDLTPGFASELGVRVVPLNVRFGDKSYKDGIDIDGDAFCAMLGGAREMPSTSLPSVGDFIAVYEEMAKDCDAILSLHLSSKLSGTYQSARIASREIDDCEIVVIDTGLVSAALQLVVVRAAREVGAGAGLERARNKIDSDIASADIFFVLDTLEFLQRGGRIGMAARVAGSMLNVKPILTVKDGEIAPVAKVRSRKKGFRRVMDIISARPSPPLVVAVGHTAVSDEADNMAALLKEAFPDVEIIRSCIGPVIATHTGPGCVEIAVL